jgi:hypothetical protein
MVQRSFAENAFQQHLMRYSYTGSSSKRDDQDYVSEHNRKLNLEMRDAMAEASLSIVLIHWKIKKDLAPDFELKWKTVFFIKNREGLIGEFLSKVEHRGQQISTEQKYQRTAFSERRAAKR